MKLFLLRPVENLPADDDPWKPDWGKAHGFVVRAEDELAARDFAHQNAGDENDPDVVRTKVISTEPWRESKYSTCVELLPIGEPGLIVRDYFAS